MSDESFNSEIQDPHLPSRCHKSWQYQRPIRRYDHYCRWLTNVIGLLNHREFFTMVMGLFLIGVSGAAIDAFLMLYTLQQGWWTNELIILLHLGYSIALVTMAGPIFRIHLGLVVRNELAAEWKRNDFYIARECKRGRDIPVNDLSDDEFNALFDSFHYDSAKNEFDRGCVKNCWSFWCISRWSPDQMGDF